MSQVELTLEEVLALRQLLGPFIEQTRCHGPLLWPLADRMERLNKKLEVALSEDLPVPR